MGIFEDFKDENIPGGPGDNHIPEFDQEEPDENRQQPREPRDFDQTEDEREQPDQPRDFDQSSPDRVNPQFPGEFDQEEPNRPDPQDPGSFDQEESNRENPGDPSQFQQEEPNRADPGEPSNFDQEEPDRAQPEDPGNFDQTEDNRQEPPSAQEFDQTEDDRAEPGDPGEFQQEEPNRESAQDPGNFQQEEPGREDGQDPGSFEQEEPNREGGEDPGSFDQEEANREPGQDPGTFDQQEVDRPEGQDPGSFQQEEPGREEPGDPSDFSQEEPGRPDPADPQQFEQTESDRTRPEEPRQFEQEENDRTEPEEPREFEQEETDRTQPEEKRDFQQTEEREEPQPPSNFEQEEDNRANPEEPRDFSQEELGREQPEEPRDFEQTEERDTPQAPDDFDQTEEGRPEPGGSGLDEAFYAGLPDDFEQTEDERFQPISPRGFEQALGNERPEGEQVGEFSQEESGRADAEEPREFEQEQSDRPEGEQLRDFDQEFGDRPQGEQIGDFTQTESDRLQPEEKPEFEQEEANRFGPEEKPEFQQEEPDENREQAPQLQFDRDGNLAELREQSVDQMLDRWSSYKDAFGQPYVLTRPDSGRLDIPAGTHTIPGRKLAEHEARLGQFLASPKGALFNLTQGALQVQQPRQETRIYNPAAGLASSAPTVNVNRHLDGLDWEEEIEQRTDGEGYLRQLTNNTEDIDGFAGASYRQRLRALFSSNMAEKNPNKWSRIPDGASLLSREITAVQTGKYDVFLGMFEYEGPDGQPRFDAYNPSLPYTSGDGEVETPTGVPNINKPDNPPLSESSRYNTLQEKNEEAKQAAEENPDQFRLGDGKIPFRRTEEIPGPRATSGEDPPGPYVSDDQEADKFHENQVGTEGEEFVLHQLPDSDDRTTHGLPNHSLADLTTDQINALPVEDYDPDAAEEPVLETERGENRQLVDFRLYDYINRKRLVFRSYLEGISISHDVEWSSERYSGRPEQYHIYGGANRTVDFSFTAFAESEAAFEAMWSKINYLQGMIYPAAFADLGDQGGGAYMVAPFAQLTLGNFFRQQFGFIESLDFDVNDDYPWEMTPGSQLTKGVDVNISYMIIEEDIPRTGDDFIKGDFIEEVN